MNTNELTAVLSRMGVSLTAREIPGVPARAVLAGSRCWRVTLTRSVKGEEKPARLNIAYLAPPGEHTKPTVSDVVQCLLSDVLAGEMTPWDFATSQGRPLTAEVENVHKTCRRMAPRVRKFFGDQWVKITGSALKAA